MILRLLCLASLLGLSDPSSIPAGRDPVKRLQAVDAIFQKHSSVSYSGVLRFKPLDDEDTLIRSGRVRLIRDPGDTLFGGFISLLVDSFERRYTGKEIFSIDHRARTVKIYKGNKEEQFGLTGNIIERLLMYSFLRENAFLKKAAAPNLVSDGGMTTVNGRTCQVISIQYPDAEEYTDDVQTYFIDTLRDVPVKVTETLMEGKHVQFQELQFSDLVFDGVKRSDLTDDRIPGGYSSSHYQPPDFTLLGNGTRAPAFTARLYPSDETKHLADFAGKVILLDFWYMSCGPCQKSIPELTALQEKYRTRGLVVIGLNWPDADSARRKKLPEFIKGRDLRYTILLAESSVADAYKVKGYPTLYLIDREGMIRFSSIGFGAKDDTLATVIERELGKGY